jgi:membrane protease YdiL (CAAX protease family)
MKIVHTGWPRIIGIIIPFCFSVFLFQFLVGQVVGLDLFDFEAERTTERQVFVTFSFLLATLFTVGFFVRFVDKERLISIGFGSKHWAEDVLYGLLLGAVIMANGYFLLLYMGEIEFQQINFDLLELIAVLLIFIFVAVAEEVLFRGYVLKNFLISFPPYAALIISSLLFSLMHGFNPNITLIGFSNLFLAGVLLGLPYLHTRKLWFPIALHFSWNFFQSFFGFKVSGSSSYSYIQFSVSENTLLNGGAFGFEGSVLAIAAHLVAIAFIGFYYEQKSQT